MMRPWNVQQSPAWFFFIVTMIVAGIITVIESIIITCDEKLVRSRVFFSPIIIKYFKLQKFLSVFKVFCSAALVLFWSFLACYGFLTDYKRYFFYLDAGKYIADDMKERFETPYESNLTNPNVLKNPSLRSLWTKHKFFDNEELQVVCLIILVCKYFLFSIKINIHNSQKFQ